MTSGGELGNRFVASFTADAPHPRPSGQNRRQRNARTAPLRTVHRSPRQRKLAGKFCPNPVLADGRRLDEHLGTGFALISAVPVNAEQRARMQQRGATLHIAGAGTDLADWLRRGHAAAAVFARTER